MHLLVLLCFYVSTTKVHWLLLQTLYYFKTMYAPYPTVEVKIFSENAFKECQVTHIFHQRV